jgi:hypothetical protein
MGKEGLTIVPRRLTVGVYIILVTLLGVHFIPPVYQNMFAFPSVSLTASMACRVYRNVKELDLDDINLHPLSDLKFVPRAPATNSTSDNNTRYSTSSARARGVHDVSTLGKSRDAVTKGSDDSGNLKPDEAISASSETREL